MTQLVPIENCIINGYSLIQNVFGTGIVVYDALGVMYTTVKNVELIGRAQTILEDIYSHDQDSLSSALSQLRAEADILDQAEFDLQAWRHGRDAESSSDALSLSGCLA
jgi:hypothetical protein